MILLQRFDDNRGHVLGRGLAAIVISRVFIRHGVGWDSIPRVKPLHRIARGTVEPQILHIFNRRLQIGVYPVPRSKSGGVGLNLVNPGDGEIKFRVGEDNPSHAEDTQEI